MKNFKTSVSIYKQFVNMWVALDETRSKVLATGKDIVEVENKLKKEKLKAYELTFIHPYGMYLAPYVYN